MSDRQIHAAWYVRTSTDQVGPVSTRRLNRWIQKGKLRPNSIVRRDDGPWKKAKLIFGLVFDDQLKRWYIRKGGRTRGPISLERLAAFASRCQIRPNTSVTLDGKKWLSAKHLPSLTFFPETEPRWLFCCRTRAPDPSMPLVALNHLRHMAQSGELKPKDRVSVDGKKWFSAKRIAGMTFPSARESTTAPVAVDTALQTNESAVDTLPPITEVVSATNSADGEELNTPAAREPESDVAWVPSELATVPLINDPPRNDSPTREASVESDASTNERSTDHEDAKDFNGTVSISLPIIPKTEVGSAERITTIQQDFESTASKRIALFTKTFGRDFDSVDISQHGTIQTETTFDLLRFHPHADRSWTTLITSGLSDYPMKFPSGSSAKISPRIEMIMYVGSMEDRFLELLGFLAVSIFASRQAIGYGWTVGNGSPPRPILAGSILSNFIFLVPPFSQDFAIKDSLTLEGDPVQPLWVVPISNAERQLIDQRGVNAFCKLCAHYQDPFVFTPLRPCYVTGARNPPVIASTALGSLGP